MLILGKCFCSIDKLIFMVFVCVFGFVDWILIWILLFCWKLLNRLFCCVELKMMLGMLLIIFL